MLTCLHMNFLFKITSLSWCHYTLKRWNNASWCYHLRALVHFIFTSYMLMFLFSRSGQAWSLEKWWLSSWVLQTFGYGGWHFKLHWAKFEIKLKFNPLKYLCLIFKFEVIKLYTSMFIVVLYVLSLTKNNLLPF
jgi:hypothetical protein